MSESTFAEFIAYYTKLPQAKGTCRIYERNDGYSVYGDDALLINQEVLKASRLKVAQAGGKTLNYVNINKSHFILALKYFLFVRQYKIEILKNTGTVRSPQWTVSYKASPGNLTAIEDLILGDNASYVQESKGLMAIKIITEASDLMVGVAYCDPVLREIQICQFTDNTELINLQSVLVQLGPQECLVPAAGSSAKPSTAHYVLQSILKTHEIAITESKAANFSAADIDQDLNRLLNLEEGMDFKISLKDESEMKYSLSAVAVIIKYLELLSDENNFGQFSLGVFKSDLYAKVGIQSVNGLGLFPESSKDFYEKHYLLGHLNNCSTHLGERLLVQWIKQPLMDLRRLEERLDIVETFVNDFALRSETSKIITKFPDIETLCRKIQRRRANLQDLYKIYMMLKQLPELHKALSKHEGIHADVLKVNFIADIQERIDDFESFTSLIESTLDFEALKNKEFIVKAEYDEQLLEIRERMLKYQNKIMAALDDAKEDLDAPTVKLECCKVIGYHFRLTRKEEKNLRHKKGYVVIDTKASGVSFQSTSLKSLNEQYVSLRKAYEEKQSEIVVQMIDVAVSFTPPLKLLSSTIAWLDVSLSFATVSVNAPKPYIRPKLREKGDCCIILKQARHPVLEARIENFIPNDVEISKDKHTFYFVTGPNMGGKSTFIRSVALNVLLAQIGCFVPCDSAEISITDAFLTRIGACDKPSKAVSTFMYEMLEVQSILKTATSSSLLIIDEMGRGTSTYDGFGLSWAISKFIAETVKAPCLFATHFHELTELSKSVPSISNLHVEAITSEGDIIFLYHVKPGVCDESFGIHIAKLAAFPDAVIEEAQKKLEELEKAHMAVNEILGKFENVPGGEEPRKKLEVVEKALNEILGKFENVPGGENSPVSATSIRSVHIAIKTFPINDEDIACLADKKMLKDSIIDFYLNYIYYEMIPAECQVRTHIFSSFFYIFISTAVEQKNKSKKGLDPKRVKKWIKNVDIFSKDFIFVPVNRHRHWYLAVICFLSQLNENLHEGISVESKESSEETESEYDSQSARKKNYTYPEKGKPCICFFDSFDKSPSLKKGKKSVAEELKTFFKMLWISKNPDNPYDWDSLPCFKAVCPQQENYIDCGLYLLQYVESFFTNPIPNLGNSTPVLKNWFSQSMMKKKRDQIKKVLSDVKGITPKAASSVSSCASDICMITDTEDDQEL